MSENSYNNVGILSDRVCVCFENRWCWEIYRMRVWERRGLKCDRCDGSHGMASKIAVDCWCHWTDLTCFVWILYMEIKQIKQPCLD